MHTCVVRGAEVALRRGAARGCAKYFSDIADAEEVDAGDDVRLAAGRGAPAARAAETVGLAYSAER